ncbi:MAG: rhodanese-like domain-containing protein [Hyphomicrobiaceae bacterium]
MANARKRPPLIFDVRSAAEFAVSHIEGATLYAGDIESMVLIRRIRSHVDHGPIVFYCTAMERSQTLADRILHDLASAGLSQPYVLAGGLIAWANAGLPLVANQDQPAWSIPTIAKRPNA